jgi:tRNA dimethylallyltransferase
MPGDAQRIVRGLEVVLASGRRLSEWQRMRPFGAATLAGARLGLTLPRTVLYHRIAARVESMAARGLAREVQALLAAGLSPEAPAFQAIGYREFVRVVRGEWTEGEAIAATVAATRRYAKRQETWWRKEASVTWFEAGDMERMQVATLAHLSTAGFWRGHDDDQAQH